MSGQHAPIDAGAAAAVLRPLAGKFGTDTVEIFGELVVRPGDTMFGLLEVKVDGSRLELVFAGQGEENDKSRHFALSIWGAAGLKTTATTVTVAKAERVRWAAREWAVHGQEVEAVSSKTRSPLPGGPAVSLS